MNVLKSLIGSLIGAAIATVMYYFLRPEVESLKLWFPVLAGVLTGVVAGVLGGNSRGRSERLLSGAISVVVAAVTMFGADVILSKLQSAELERRSSAKRTEPSAEAKKELVKSDADASDAEKVEGDAKTSEADSKDVDNEAGDGKQVAEVAASDSERGAAGESGAPMPSAEQKEMGAKMVAEIERKRKIDEWLELILPGVGILLAYQFARGFRNQPAEKHQTA